MKKPASTLKIASHIFMALVIYFLIFLIPTTHPWLKVTLFIAWGTYFFIDLLKLMLIGTRYSISGAYFIFCIGCLVVGVSLVWFGNLVFKVALNPLFGVLAWEFRIGNLFTGIYQYIFSIPSIIAGVVMIIVAALWENNVQYHEWRQSLFPGSHKRMFRKEF